MLKEVNDCKTIAATKFNKPLAMMMNNNFRKQLSVIFAAKHILKKISVLGIIVMLKVTIEDQRIKIVISTENQCQGVKDRS